MQKKKTINKQTNKDTKQTKPCHAQWPSRAKRQRNTGLPRRKEHPRYNIHCLPKGRGREGRVDGVGGRMRCDAWMQREEWRGGRERTKKPSHSWTHEERMGFAESPRKTNALCEQRTTNNEGRHCLLHSFFCLWLLVLGIQVSSPTDLSTHGYHLCLVRIRSTYSTPLDIWTDAHCATRPQQSSW